MMLLLVCRSRHEVSSSLRQAVQWRMWPRRLRFWHAIVLLTHHSLDNYESGAAAPHSRTLPRLRGGACKFGHVLECASALALSYHSTFTRRTLSRLRGVLQIRPQIGRASCRARV